MDERLRENEAEMSAEIKRLHLKALGSRIMIIGGLAAAAAFVLIDNVIVLIASVIVALLGAAFAKKTNERLKSITGTGILSQALADVFDDVDYRPLEHLSSVQVNSAGFDFSYNNFEGSDYTRASYRGIGIELSDVDLISSSTDSDGNHSEDHRFHGLWVICNLGKEFNCDCRLAERSAVGKVFVKGGLKTDNAAFNKKFNITADNKEELCNILTPHMMEYILSIDKAAKAKTYIRVMRDGTLHIALDTGKDAFAIKGFVSEAAQIRKQYVDTLRLVTGLIDIASALTQK